MFVWVKIDPIWVLTVSLSRKWMISTFFFKWMLWLWVYCDEWS